MNTTELQLPKKIFPVEYAGFFDFNEEGVYGTSVITRDDYPNAEQIANEISKRYNNFNKMKEMLEDCYMAMYGGNSVDVADAIRRTPRVGLSPFEDKFLKLLESLK